MMNKPSYIVVSCVLLVLGLLATARQLLYPYLPPATTNRLEGSSQRFLSAAGHYQVNWHILEEDALKLGKSSGKPILLVVGLYGSRVTQDMDTAMFADTDTARFVSENYYCIRIDGYEHPEWLNAVLPISRLSMQLYPGFQVWVLDSSGHVQSYIGRWSGSSSIENQQLFRELVEARHRYDEMKAQGTGIKLGLDKQQVDLDLLGSQSGSANPHFPEYAAQLSTLIDSVHGGFPTGDIHRLYPNVWRYFSMTGNSRLWKRSLEPLLLSPIMDIKEGGFFRLSNSRDFTKVEFAKPSRLNAEMMKVLAIQGQIDGDSFYNEIASETFDFLFAESENNKMIPACQEDEESPQARSPRRSYPSWMLRDKLSAADRDWAVKNLKLDPRINPQMVPYITSRLVLLDPNNKYQEVLEALKPDKKLKPIYSDTGYMDVNGHTVARMLEVARMWGDSDRLLALQTCLNNLEMFRSGTTITHRTEDIQHQTGYLGDYLGYADAKLQEYLATGNLVGFQQGLSVLNAAIERFKGDRMGQFNLSASPSDMGGFDMFCMPEISDDLGESCTAQMIRLMLAYGRLLGDTVSGRNLIQLAKESTYLFSDIANAGGPDTAGFFCAAAEVMDDRYAVAVGPRAKDLSALLYRRIPTRFIAPALGGLRPDIQKRGPGIYLIGKSVEGPFSVEEAAQRLPTTLVGTPHR